MKLVVGLGNPGRKYTRTRHNVGWRVVDELVAELNEYFSFVKNCESDVVKISDDHGIVIIIKPQTFMNESGRAVRAAMDYYKIALSDVVVVHDDKDLPFGTIRLRVGGSSAGHNGVQSVIEHIGEGFARVRVGVANIEMAKFDDAADFVLARFTKEEEARLTDIVDATVAAVREWQEHGLDPKSHRDITV